MKTDTLITFIAERYRILMRRTFSAKKPWTKDPILVDYKFTNVHRENDRVTIWIANNWRTPNKNDPDLWFAMVVARLLNRPESLERLGYAVPWKRDRFVHMIHDAKSVGIPSFSGAYMISTHGMKADKAEFLADRVLTPLWENRKYIRPRKGDTLAKFHARLTEHFGMGSFLGAQVVADMKYVKPLMGAVDYWTWASSGPGSRRGLNRIVGRPTSKSWREEDWLNVLQQLQNKVEVPLLKRGVPRLHAQDLQNCLCEFDKYERVRLNEGRMKQRYNGRS